MPKSRICSRSARAWFEHWFDVPTAAQSQAWPVIHAGGNALVVAPTGSGKTLCAFLSAIDRLMTGEADRLNGSGAMIAPKGAADVSGERRRTRRVKVLYVSPLKALAVDVAKNLRAPLDGIAAECEAPALPLPISASPYAAVTRRHGRDAPSPPSAGHPRHDAGIAVSAADVQGARHPARCRKWDASMRSMPSPAPNKAARTWP